MWQRLDGIGPAVCLYVVASVFIASVPFARCVRSAAFSYAQMRGCANLRALLACWKIPSLVGLGFKKELYT